MKKTLSIIAFSCIFLTMNAQDDSPKNEAKFELGDGLNFSLNNGDYQFNISGFIQPSYQYSEIRGNDAENEFNAKNAFVMLSGKAIKEKVSFLIQTDYSRNEALMDAWIAYHPTKNITITGGQKQTFVNNKEMTFREDRLQFTDRSFLSQNTSETGREFGLFVETKFGNDFGIAPMVALTSGDGRNSFGSNSTDPDLGGLKIGGRLDLYPLGFFTEGNELYSADLAHEQSLKFAIGFAGSINTGVSSKNGEGHADFTDDPEMLLFDGNGQNNLPDYNELFYDLLVKYKGFSLLAEYIQTSAELSSVTYTDKLATKLLIPGQISEFLVLGNAFNAQVGYVTKKGLSFDFRYENAKPEFDSNVNSVLTEYDAYTFGLTKYFDNNNLKMQATVSSVEPQIGNNQTIGEFLVQIAF